MDRTLRNSHVEAALDDQIDRPTSRQKKQSPVSASMDAYLAAKTVELQRANALNVTSPEIQAMQLKLAKRKAALELFKLDKEAESLGFTFTDDD